MNPWPGKSVRRLRRHQCHKRLCKAICFLRDYFLAEASFPPVGGSWLTPKQCERWYENTPLERDETAIKVKLLTRPNQGVVVTVMDYVALAVFVAVKVFHAVREQNDRAVNGFCWLKKENENTVSNRDNYTHFSFYLLRFRDLSLKLKQQSLCNVSEQNFIYCARRLDMKDFIWKSFQGKTKILATENNSAFLAKEMDESCS